MMAHRAGPAGPTLAQTVDLIPAAWTAL